MRIEKLGEHKFLIFVNSLYLDVSDFDKEKIVELVKKLLLKFRHRLHLQGFYKVKVYLQSMVGMFLELVQLEKFECDYSLDFRVLVYFDDKIFFKTKDYFILPITAGGNIYYLNGYYYCCVDDLYDVFQIVEFGEFIYGKELYSIMSLWRKC